MIVNTVDKTVQPQGENIGEILSALEDMFPNGQWAEYKICTEKVIEYHYYPYQTFNTFQTQPYTPYYEQFRITCGDTTTGVTVDKPFDWPPVPKFL